MQLTPLDSNISSNNTPLQPTRKRQGQYYDRFIPYNTHEENWKSSSLQAAKRATKDTLGKLYAETMYPDANPRVLSFTSDESPKPYPIPFSPKKVPMPTFETKLDAPNITQDFYESALTIGKMGSYFAVKLENDDKSLSDLYLCDTELTKKVVPIHLENRKKIIFIKLSPDAKNIFFIQDGKVRNLKLETGNIVTSNSPSAKVLDVVNDHEYAVGTEDTKVMLFDTREENSRKIIQVPGNNKVTKCLFEGDLLAVGTNGDVFALYDKRKYETPLVSYTIKAAVRAIDFDPINSRIFFGGGSADGKIRRVNYNVGQVDLDTLPFLDLKAQITDIKVMTTFTTASRLFCSQGYSEKEQGIIYASFHDSTFTSIGLLPSTDRILDMELCSRTSKLIAVNNAFETIDIYSIPLPSKGKENKHTSVFSSKYYPGFI